jgi:exonuclease III
MKIATINAGSPVTLRLEDILQWADTQNIDILAIQETHISKETQMGLKSTKYIIEGLHKTKAQSIAKFRMKKAEELEKKHGLKELTTQVPMCTAKAGDDLGHHIN